MKEGDNDKMNDAVRRLPKIELHAHLNGCIRESTLFELAKERNVEMNEAYFAKQTKATTDHGMYNVQPRSLQDCFAMFGEIPKCVNDIASLQRITREALHDFAQHGVAYLELRSTPKQFGSADAIICDKRGYCQTILDVLEEFEREEMERYEAQQTASVDDNGNNIGNAVRLPMRCNFIVSIDRSKSVEAGMENVNVALQLKESNPHVVGVDLGGNPTKNDFADFRECFQRARDGGLKVSIHCGEYGYSLWHYL